MGGFWTQDRIDIASGLWKEGKSLSDIATSLGNGATKNSVAGKIDRLGLMNTRPKYPRKLAAPKGNVADGRLVKSPRVASNVVGKRPPLKIDPSKVDVSSPFALPDAYIGFMDLTGKTCRWPFDGPRGTFYCGDDAVDCFSYCESHRCLSLNRRQAKLLKAA